MLQGGSSVLKRRGHPDRLIFLVDTISRDRFYMPSKLVTAVAHTRSKWEDSPKDRM